MKYSLLLLIIMLPCLAVLNQSDSFVPNILGIIYSVCLYVFFTETNAGRKFSKHLDDELNKF